MEPLTTEQITEILHSNELITYKPIGKTPKDLVDYYLEQLRPFCPKVKGCFIGRLDPMAHGITKIFLNKKCKEAKDEILLKSDKQYRFKILVGISTSSNDVLGKITTVLPITITKKQLEDSLEILKGITKQEIPIHSSFIVRNKDGLKNPLWWWAKEKRLSEIERPVLERHMYNYRFLGEETITKEDLLENVKIRVDLIDKKHDFCQEEIKENWEKTFETLPSETTFQIIEVEVDVSNGFYIRQLVNEISKTFEVPMLAFDILRTKYL